MKLINSFKKVLAKHKLTYVLLSNLVYIHLNKPANTPAKKVPMFLIDNKEYIKLDNIPTLGDDELTRVLSPFINSEDIYGVLYEDAKINPLGVDGKPICVYNIRSTGILYIVNDNVIWADVKCLAKLSNMSYDDFIAKVDDANLYGEQAYANIKGIKDAIYDKDIYKEVFTMHVNLGDTGMYKGVLKIDGKLLPYTVAYGDVWVAGNTLVDILEYKDKTRALQSITDPSHKCFLGYLNEYIANLSKIKIGDMSEQSSLTPPIFDPCEYKNFNNYERTIYLNRQGTVHLINKSRKPIAKRIRENMEKIYAKILNNPGVDVNMNLLYTELTPNLTEEIKASIFSGEPTTKVDPPSDYSEAYARRHLPKKYYTTCIYIFYTYRLDMYGKKIYKIGETDDINQRLTDHVKKYGCIDEIYVFPCINVNKAEKNCLYALRVLKALKNKLQCINGKNTKELLTIPEHMTHGDILSTIESGVKAADDEIVSNEVRIEEEKTKQEQEKTKQREMDILIEKEKTNAIMEQEKTKQEQEKTKQEQEKTKQREMDILIEKEKTNAIMDQEKTKQL